MRETRTIVDEGGKREVIWYDTKHEETTSCEDNSKRGEGEETKSQVHDSTSDFCASSSLIHHAVGGGLLATTCQTRRREEYEVRSEEGRTEKNTMVAFHEQAAHAITFWTAPCTIDRENLVLLLAHIDRRPGGDPEDRAFGVEISDGGCELT